jgi:tetratricopeptide (TPR) repeat protein
MRTALAVALVALTALDALPARAGKAEDEAIVLYKQGVDLGNQGKLDEAIGAFQQAIAKAPKSFDVAYLKLGLAYEMASRWPEALAAYDVAIAIDKQKKPDGYGFLGSLYRKMGLFDMAVQAHREAVARGEKAFEKKPEKLADLQYELALDYIEMKLYGDAIAALDKALTKVPTSKPHRLLLANVNALAEKWDEAEAQYKKLLEADPNDADAMYGLGFVDRKRGKKEEAREWFRKACDLKHPKACRERH